MTRWLPLLAVSLGSFMLMVDVTIVIVALPDIAVDLHASFAATEWVVDVYALALAVLLIGVGALADAHGHRRTFLTGLALFVLASVSCGLAPDAGLLLAARGVQGIGAAAMFATSFALINASYSGRDRGTAYGVFGAISGAAAALGPLVGGVLTQGISWRWIFFVNAPLGVVTIALTALTVPAVRVATRRRVDLAGIAAFTVTAGALTFASIRSTDDGWGSPTVVALLAATVLGAAAFLLVEARSAQPLIELALFREPRFAATVLASLVLTFSAYGVLNDTTVWTQTVLGLSPVEAGLVFLPLPVVVAALSPFSARVTRGVPRSVAIGGGVALVGLGGLLTALLISLTPGWAALLPGPALMGVGLGLGFPLVSRTATEAVGDARAGMAGGAVNTARQLGQAFGIALLGSLAAARVGTSLRSAGVGDPGTAASELLGGQARSVRATAAATTGVDLDGALHTAFAAGLELAYLVAGVVAVVSGLVIAHLLRDGHRAGAAEGTSRTNRPVGTTFGLR